jgi:IclR family KDG regulon transcriptional repressor
MRKPSSQDSERPPEADLSQPSAGSTAPGMRGVTRTLDLLDAIAAAPGKLDLATLARASELHPATALRYLSSLEARGFIRHLPGTGYQLGARLFELGSAFVEQATIYREVQQPLEELANRVQETASAGILYEGDVLYIAVVQGQRELGIQSSAGVRHPAYCTSLGKAILAHLPAEKVKSVVTGRPLEPLTDRTITEVPKLYKDLLLVRDRGYALDDEERHEGVFCVGAPIFDHSGKVAGALSVSGPKFRMVRSASDTAKFVVSAASAVSRRLGAPQQRPV